MHTDDFRPITGSQLRAARALLRWSQDDLARKIRGGLAGVAQAAELA
jgi:transcriptional regulator with XRE-family HTH domain